MEKATDKQIAFLAKNGIDGDELTKQQASAEIEKIIGAQSKGFVKTLKVPEQETIVKEGFKPKKSFDTSSYYVAYAKDLTIAMLEAHDNAMSRDPSVEPLEIERLMGEAIQCIKFAKKEFS